MSVCAYVCARVCAVRVIIGGIRIYEIQSILSGNILIYIIIIVYDEKCFV